MDLQPLRRLIPPNANLHNSRDYTKFKDHHETHVSANLISATLFLYFHRSRDVMAPINWKKKPAQKKLTEDLRLVLEAQRAIPGLAGKRRFTHFF